MLRVTTFVVLDDLLGTSFGKGSSETSCGSADVEPDESYER